MWLRSIFITFILAAISTGSFAADKSGSKDHPLIKRYAGSEIFKYATIEFDEYGLFVRPATAYGGRAKNLSSQKMLERKLTQISYRGNKGRCSLEVFRNYLKEFNDAGFEPLFECVNEVCGGRSFNHAVGIYAGGFAENYKDQRFYSGVLARPEGDLYVSLYVVRNYSKGGRRKNMIISQLDVVELKAMEQKMVTVSAEEMSTGLEKSGHIAIYGIYFDSDKATLKTTSEPALTEISKLLTAHPKLSLWIVGHTDNVGALDYNRDLSLRRAKAVVAALVSRFRIKSKRLIAEGVGFLAPVASNQNDKGKALNRRVELISR